MSAYSDWKCGAITEDEYRFYCRCEELEELAEESGHDKPDDGCWNCMNFDWRREACTVNWNNMDESYYNPDTDDRELTDYCEYHEIDPDTDPECLKFGGNEP